VTTALVDAYDAALFDLDGVIYLGPVAVEGAVATIAALARRGTRVMYVTNNAARSADTVVDHLARLGFEAGVQDVLTSAQVAAVGIAEALPPGAKVLVAGSRNLADLLAEAGLTPVRSAEEDPVAVVQGYDPTLPWSLLDEACLAIQRGATWYATNDDASRPTDRGTVPGAGGMIAVIATALGGAPTTFGKPFRPMLAQAVRRVGARRPLFVGDRIDTDIVGANNASMDSLMVFSGAHGKAELLAAGPGERPTHIGADVRALLRPARHVTVTDATTADCGGQRVGISQGVARITTEPAELEQQFDALWALAALAWLNPALACADALEQLDQVR
jgi:HAD superfamily hydrolase (TIGR01450 family)